MTEYRVHHRARVSDQERSDNKILCRTVHMVVEDRIHILPLCIHNLCGHGESACYEEQEGEEEYVQFLFHFVQRFMRRSHVSCPQADVSCFALSVALRRFMLRVTCGGAALFCYVVARGRVVVVNSFYLFLLNDNADFCFLVYLVSSSPQPPLTTLVVSNTA